jgi:hypothetical protein
MKIDETLTKVLSIAAAFAALLSSLAVTGVLGQMERNHGVLFAASCSCVFLAASLWVAVAIFPSSAAPKPGATKWGDDIRRWFHDHGAESAQLLGLAALAAGLILGVVALIQTQNDPDQPSITVTELSATSMTARVNATGLSTRDTMQVRVDGLIGAPGAVPTEGERKLLFWASLGGDIDGKIDLPVHVAIPAGDKITAVAVVASIDGAATCSRTAGKSPGCVIALLPAK